MNFLPGHARYDAETARVVRERRAKAAAASSRSVEDDDEDLALGHERDWAGLTSDSSASDFETVSEPDRSSSRTASRSGDDDGPTPHHSPGHSGDIRPELLSRHPIASPVFGHGGAGGGNGGEESDSSFDPQAWKSGERGTGGSRSASTAASVTAHQTSHSPDATLSVPRGRTRSRSIGSSAFRDDVLDRGSSSPPHARTPHEGGRRRMSNLSALLQIHSAAPAPAPSPSREISSPRPSFSMQRQDTYRAPAHHSSLGLSQPAVHEAFASAAATTSALDDEDDDFVHHEDDAPLTSSVASLQSLPGTDTEFVSSADEGIQQPPPSFPSSRPVDISFPPSSANETQSLYLPTSPASAPTALASTSPRKPFALRRAAARPNTTGRSSVSPHRSASDLGAQASASHSPSGATRRGRKLPPRHHRRRSPSTSNPAGGSKSRRRATGPASTSGRISADEAELLAGGGHGASEEFLQALENLRVMASFGKSRPGAVGASQQTADPSSSSRQFGASSSGTVIPSSSHASPPPAASHPLPLAFPSGGEGAGVISASAMGAKATSSLPRVSPRGKSSEDGEEEEASAYADDPTSDEGLARAEAGHGGAAASRKRAKVSSTTEKDGGEGRQGRTGGEKGETRWWRKWLGGSWTVKTWQVVGIVGLVLGVGIGAGSILGSKRIGSNHSIFHLF